MAGLDKTKSEVTNAGGSCQTFLGDVSRREHVQCAVDGAISHFNMSPSIGINCAGKKNYFQFNCILLCIEHFSQNQKGFGCIVAAVIGLSFVFLKSYRVF